MKVMRFGALLLALVGSLLLLPVSAAQAAVTGSVSVSAPDVTQQTWDCPCPGSDVSFSVVAPNPSEFLYYKYYVRVDGPEGLSRSWSGEAYYGGNWQWKAYLSPGLDEYGTYMVSATVEFFGYAGNVPIDTKTASATFSFTGPPKPEPVRYTTQIKGSVFNATYFKRIRWFSATVQSEYRSPRAGETGLPARFRLLVGSKAVASRSLTWLKTDDLSVKLPRKKRTRVYVVRIEINGHVVFTQRCKVKGRKR